MKIATIFISLLFASQPLLSTEGNKYYEDHPITLTDEQQQEVNEYLNQEYLAQEAERACDILRKELKGEELSDSDQDFYQNLTEEQKKAYNKDAENIDKNSRTGKKRFSDSTFDPCNASNDALIGAVFGETGDQMLEMAVKAYSTVMGMSSMGGKNKIAMKKSGYKDHQGVKDAKTQLSTAKEADVKDGVKDARKNLKDQKTDRAKNETEDKNDLCAYIPMATETLGMVTLNAKADNIENDQIVDSNSNSQQESFFKMARMQNARKVAADMQFYGWGATGICYAGYMTAGAVIDAKIVAKTAAATLLSTYYKTKSKRHKRAEAYFNFMGTKFANMKGKCHPITDKQCFCSLKSSQNLQMCLPTSMTNRTVPLKEITGCVNNKLEADPNCNCYPNCFNVQYKRISGYGQFNGTTFSSAFDETTPLFQGGFDQASMESTTNRQNAMTKRYLKSIADQMPPDLGKNQLSSQQLAQAKELVSQGFSPAVARHMSSLPVNEKGKSAEQKWKLDSNQEMQTAAENHLKNPGAVVYFNQNIKKKSGSSEKEFNPFSQFMKKGQKKEASTGEVISFAEKAQNEAQIEKDSGKAIFDIISHRYRTSTWKKFNVMENINNEKQQ